MNHPILNKDPDVHEFLQNTEDFIRTTSNQLLSGVSAKKIMKNFGDAIGKFTYKVDDPNEVSFCMITCDKIFWVSFYISLYKEI